jgi:DNA adenine methylase
MTESIIPNRSIFPRAGGKKYIAKKLIELFPSNYTELTYVEPFVGGGGVFFRKQRSAQEIINDLDTKVYAVFNEVKQRNINDDVNRQPITKEHFFEVLMDNENPVRIVELFKTSFLANAKSYDRTKGCYGIKTDFSIFHRRLNSVTIFNEDYKSVIAQFDNPDTFFYLDPPYNQPTKKRMFYDNYVEVNELLETVRQIKGKFMLSYNDTVENRELFKEFNIQTIATSYSPTTHINKRNVTELVITNY